jgi:hypothetical protein
VVEADEPEPSRESTNDESSRRSAGEPLRQLSLPQQRLGGYARDAVDETIAKAARTIERLQDEVTAGQEEVARLQAAQVKLQDELKLAARRSAQEIVGDVLVTAHRAAESVIEEARRQAANEQEAARHQALQLLARAQELLAEATATNRDAQAVVADGRARAQALIAAGAAEANAHVASATESAARRQAQLEVENARLETAIKGLRNEWVGRAAEALARLDRVDSDRPLGAAAPQAASGEVVQDLQTRVHEKSTGPVPGQPLA